tara:strand:- start:8938 stop:9984 length:1047 start_codon:yes stop_codon:yes gene_type:complete
MQVIRQILLMGAVAVFLLAGPVKTFVYGQPAASAEVARVGDIIVTLDDLDQAWSQNDVRSQMRLFQQLYETRRRVLDVVVGNHLIDREAVARGLSRDELLAIELPLRILPITDEEIALVYGRNREALGDRTLDESRSEIQDAIERQRPVQALRQFMADLRREADDVVLTLDPPRQQVEVFSNDPSQGPTDAPILLVEFSDFQCPYCQRATGILSDLIDRYADQIRFIYKDFPLSNHPQAFKAAEAGNCAHEQGMFWSLHDKMFVNQDALDVPALNSYALELGLDAEAFSICLEEGRYSEQVQQDLQAGRRSGVSSTPTVFINGRPIMGAVPLETLEEIVREELVASGR